MAVVLVAALVTMEVFNKSPSLWITQKLLGYPTKYVEHDVSLTVAGRPIEVRGTIECLPFNVAEIGNLTQLHYIEEQQAISRRLDDGRILLIVVPNLCYKSVGTEVSLWPLLGLLDTNARPSFFQLFIVPDSPAARMSGVQFTAMHSRVSDSASSADADMPVLQWRTRTEEPTSYDNRFATNALGVFGWAVSRSELAGVYGLQRLPGKNDIDEIAGKDPAGLELEKLLPNRFSRIYRGLEGDIDQPIISSPLSELEVERRIIPFRLEDGRFVPSPDDRGTLLYFFEPFPIRNESGTTHLNLQQLLEQLNHSPKERRARLVQDLFDESRDEVVFATRLAIGSIHQTEGGKK